MGFLAQIFAFFIAQPILAIIIVVFLWVLLSLFIKI